MGVFSAQSRALSRSRRAGPGDASVSVELDTSEVDWDGVAEVAVDSAMDRLEHIGFGIADRVVVLGTALHAPMHSRPYVQRNEDDLTVSVDFRRVRARTAAIAAQHLHMAKRSALAEGE